LQARQDDGELVASQSRYSRADAHVRLQLPGDGLQHRISGRVTQAVVDRLEAIDVDYDYTDKAGVLGCLLSRPFELFARKLPVRKTGERIVIVGPAQILLRGHLIVDILEIAVPADNGAISRAPGIGARPEPAVAAVTLAQTIARVCCRLVAGDQHLIP